MPTELLATKLLPPAPGVRLVGRPRLLRRLDERLRPGCRLTLVSAPPGFGKTTLVSAWSATARGLAPHPAVAWLSLDERDNDPLLF
jgi:LuxR family transcriptional regulator, maltose regulon positive regulatory protein